MLTLGSMGSAFAYQLEGTNYDGVQVDDTFYSLGYILNHESTFVDIFGPAATNKVILDFNHKSAKFSDYLFTNPADFDAWASVASHQTPAAPKTFIKADGTSVTVVAPLTVVSVIAKNKTTIEVRFSNNEVKTYTGFNLVSGNNTVTINYDATQIFTNVVVSYVEPAAAVEKVEFVNYRNFVVTFNTIVQAASAADPANYYFEIVEGNAEYGSAFLGSSNQLKEIDTKFPGWWDVEEENIVASVVDGKTVVSINLPEDSRFTNELDLTSLDNDDERTIIANIANLVNQPSGNDSKEMIKDTTVNIAVRNVRDASNARTISTKVLPMLILDTKAPEFLGYSVVDAVQDIESYGVVRQEIELTSDGSDTVALEFNEPVFNAHGLGVDDINNTRKFNIAVYVDGILVGSKENNDLKDVLTFAMSSYDTYDEARFATLDVKAAVEKAYGDAYKASRKFRVSIVGIPDLAGNTQVPNPVEFTASIVDPDPINPDLVDPVIPAVNRVVQIHDNTFRVIFNRADVTAQLEILNADGEDGLVVASITGQNMIDTNDDGIFDFFFSDVSVPAVDIELGDALNEKNNNILAYDNQKSLIRMVRVYDVKVPSQTLEGAAFIDPAFVITKDIYAPNYVQPTVIEHDSVQIIDGQLIISMEDQVPESWDEVGQPVNAMLYNYAWSHEDVFEPTINVTETEKYNTTGPIDYDTYTGPDLLPILVSYTDANNVLHQALVSNKWISEDFTNGYFSPPKPGWTQGYTGTIRYYANSMDLVLDLSNYPQLTDANGNLVKDVTYSVEIPDGYFADPAKMNAYQIQSTEQYPILYVSDGRHNNEGSFTVRGYVANEMTVELDVEKDPLPPVVVPDDAVPQTSKLLINYVQDTNKIWVEFNGQIKESTLEDLDHFKVNGKTLRELGLSADAVQYVKQISNYESFERQFAVIDLGYDTIAITGDYTFEAFGVTNLVGGMMTPVETRLDLVENTRPIVEVSKVTGSNQIVLTFDEALMFGDDVDADEINAGFASVDNFAVILNGGIAITPITAVLSQIDHKTVTLTVGADLANYATILVEIQLDQNSQMSLEDISANHNPIKVATVVVK